MSKSLIFFVNRSFAHFWTKNERFARKGKTDERIPSPALYKMHYWAHCGAWRFWKTLKWQCNEIVWYFPRIDPFGPLINGLKWFCWKNRICGDIRKIKKSYIRENKSLSKTVLVCLSGAQVNLIHEKNFKPILWHWYFKSVPPLYILLSLKDRKKNKK